jgi:PHD/YefM family antitoxin component YafN of YafNO toxin-antitoxin module
MDFNQLKKIIKDSGDKLIFMENGEPSFVMMPFARYQREITQEAEKDNDDLLQSEENFAGEDFITEENLIEEPIFLGPESSPQEVIARQKEQEESVANDNQKNQTPKSDAELSLEDLPF